MGVVAHLRQQAAQADAVGRTQRHGCLEAGIVQGLLDHGLAVIEHASHTQCMYVVAKTTQLVGLTWRYTAIRVQNDDTQSGLPMKCRRHRSTRITGGSHQNRQGTFGITS